MNVETVVRPIVMVCEVIQEQSGGRQVEIPFNAAPSLGASEADALNRGDRSRGS